MPLSMEKFLHFTRVFEKKYQKSPRPKLFPHKIFENPPLEKLLATPLRCINLFIIFSYKIEGYCLFLHL